MARVTGIGGVFLRSTDPKRLTAWYAEHLGFVLTDYGVTFEWTDEIPKGTGSTTWSAFPCDTKYFDCEESADTFRARQAVMINYRVDDLDGLLHTLSHAGVWIDHKRDDQPYGKFAWIKDCDGNRVELWEPVA